MKQALILTIAAIAIAAPAFADDTHHHPEKEKPAAAQPAAQPQPSAATKDAAAPMDNMKKMQEQMAQLRATNDPKERNKLLDEHMQAMQETLGTMRDMHMHMHEAMMGGGKDGKHSHADSDPHMHMMEMMMEQMSEHQKAMQGMSK